MADEAAKPDRARPQRVQLYLDREGVGWRAQLVGDVSGSVWRPTRRWAKRAGKRLIRDHLGEVHSLDRDHDRNGSRR